MNTKEKIKQVIEHPVTTFYALLCMCFGGMMSDKLYLSLLYRMSFGKKLNWKNPQTFSEKLQWLKLYNRKPEYSTMVDKAAAKDYVVSIIGDQYIIPTIGIWNSVDEIEWDKLPEKFVLKTTHDSGSVVICTNKSQFDKEAAVSKLAKSLKFDFYKKSREWPYKNVPHRIIAEKYIDPAPNVKDIPDYKWYCFNGEPKYCQVIQGRSTNETIDFFDTEWKHQNFVGLNPVSGPNFVSADIEPERPERLETHLRIARELSKDIPYSRIDLYETGEHTYFGEITFYPKGGLGVFDPDQYNEILGQMIKLPGEKRGG